jgi:hypothetical protein
MTDYAILLNETEAKLDAYRLQRDASTNPNEHQHIDIQIRLLQSKITQIQRQQQQDEINAQTDADFEVALDLADEINRLTAQLIDTLTEFNRVAETVNQAKYQGEKPQIAIAWSHGPKMPLCVYKPGKKNISLCDRTGHGAIGGSGVYPRLDALKRGETLR